jgi:hypothetical protein
VEPAPEFRVLLNSRCARAARIGTLSELAKLLAKNEDILADCEREVEQIRSVVFGYGDRIWVRCDISVEPKRFCPL